MKTSYDCIIRVSDLDGKPTDPSDALFILYKEPTHGGTGGGTGTQTTTTTTPDKVPTGGDSLTEETMEVVDEPLGTGDETLLVPEDQLELPSLEPDEPAGVVLECGSCQ